MRYMLTKGSVIYLIPGKKGVKINCIEGNLWVTKKSEVRDVVMENGDHILLKNCGKVAIQAFSNACFDLEGKKFNLLESKSGRKQLVIHKIASR